MAIRSGWYKIEKFYRGGSDCWAFYLNKKRAKEYCKEEELLSHIGENTGGGGEYGFRMKSRFFGLRKPKNTDFIFLGTRTISQDFFYTKGGEYSKNRRKKVEKHLKKIELQRNKK